MRALISALVVAGVVGFALPAVADEAVTAPNKRIADVLHVAEGTIKQHLKDLFRRLNARNRTQAVKEARRLGLLRK